MSFTQGLSGSLSIKNSVTVGGNISSTGGSVSATTDDTDALLIEQSGGTDVFRVDTVNNNVYINNTTTTGVSAFPLTVAHNSGAAQIALEHSGGSPDGKVGIDGSGNLEVSNNGTINLSADSGTTAHLVVGTSTVDVGTLKLSSASIDTSSGSLSLSSAGGTAVTIDSAAAVSADEISVSSGSNSDPSYTFSGDLTTGMYSAASGDVSFSSSGSLITKIDSSGIVMTTSKTISNLPNPSAAGDVANKSYVDSVAQGLNCKESVRAATDTAGTLSTDFEDGDSIDGISLSTGDRILIKNQSSGVENGIYVVNASGSPSRSSDLPVAANAAGVYMFVEEGAVNADVGYVCTNDSGSDVVGTDILVFSTFTSLGSFTGGDGINVTSTVISVDEKTNGGLVIESGELAVDLGASSITGTLAVSDGGTGLSTFGDSNTVLYTSASDTLASSSNFTYDGSELDILASSGPNINFGITGSLGDYKIVLFDTVGADSTKYGIGIASATMFYNVNGSAVHRFDIGGTESARVDSNGIKAANGSLSNPSLSFINDSDTGLYTNASGTINFTSNGSWSASLSNTSLQVGSFGTVSVPAYAFTGDVNTGIYRSAADELAVSTGGSNANTFSSKGLDGWKLLETQTASNDTSIIFTTMTTHRDYLLVISNCQPTTASALEFRFREGGSSKAVNYQWSRLSMSSSSSSVVGASDNEVSGSPTEITLTPGNVSTDNTLGGLSMEIKMNHYGNGLAHSGIRFMGNYTDDSGTSRNIYTQGSGFNDDAPSSAWDGLEILFSSGNVDFGEFKLYGFN